MSKLTESFKDPTVRAGVKRQAAKLDAEEQGWVVLEPKHYRALLEVERSAKMRDELLEMDLADQDYWDDRLVAAKKRLSRLRAGREGRTKP